VGHASIVRPAASGRRLVASAPAAASSHRRHHAKVVVVVIAFFAALFTGRWPGRLRDFALGVGRWQLRINDYLVLLTDEYPAQPNTQVDGPCCSNAEPNAPSRNKTLPARNTVTDPEYNFGQ